MAPIGRVRGQPANPPGMLLICKLDALPALAHQYESCDRFGCASGLMYTFWITLESDICKKQQPPSNMNAKFLINLVVSFFVAPVNQYSPPL